VQPSARDRPQEREGACCSARERSAGLREFERRVVT